MTEQFDDHLLDEFAHNFYGYGNYSGQFWFTGMEEGGGDSFLDITKRLNAWADRGKCELEDVEKYHNAIGITYLFNDRPKLQPTWSKLIRILLSSNGQTPTTEQVREYQRISLGRIDGDTCLLELLPLPSPSTGHWLYAQHSRLPYVADRETYKKACLTLRIAHLQKQVNEHKPKVVVFYSLSYREYWQAIAGVELLQESGGVYAGRNRSTLFIMTMHPAAKGVTSEYFDRVGKLIHARTGGQ